jgi:hypothetical protein
MGLTWDSMEKEYKDMFGTKSKHYGAITGTFRAVPDVIAEKRRQTTGIYGNEPFDLIVYKPTRR